MNQKFLFFCSPMTARIARLVDSAPPINVGVDLQEDISNGEKKVVYRFEKSPVPRFPFKFPPIEKSRVPWISVIGEKDGPTEISTAASGSNVRVGVHLCEFQNPARKFREFESTFQYRHVARDCRGNWNPMQRLCPRTLCATCKGGVYVQLAVRLGTNKCKGRVVTRSNHCHTLRRQIRKAVETRSISECENVRGNVQLRTTYKFVWWPIPSWPLDPSPKA